MKITGKRVVGRRPASLCWYCEKATGGCRWSKYFQPVKGWKALSTVLYHSKGEGGMKSFLVLDCPEFTADIREEPENRRKRQRFLARGYYDRETPPSSPEQRCGTCRRLIANEGLCTLGSLKRKRNLYQWCYAWEADPCRKKERSSR